jgi:hypothetical protein
MSSYLVQTHQSGMSGTHQGQRILGLYVLLEAASTYPSPTSNQMKMKITQL